VRPALSIGFRFPRSQSRSADKVSLNSRIDELNAEQEDYHHPAASRLLAARKTVIIHYATLLSLEYLIRRTELFD
jgi:hypothetical protein